MISLANVSPEDDGKCTVICAVMQKFRRELRAVGLDDLDIGFVVYPLGGGRGEMGQKQVGRDEAERHKHNSINRQMQQIRTEQCRRPEQSHL